MDTIGQMSQSEMPCDFNPFRDLSTSELELLPEWLHDWNRRVRKARKKAMDDAKREVKGKTTRSGFTP